MKKIFVSLASISSFSLILLPGDKVLSAQPCAPQPCPCPKAFQGIYLGGNIGYGIGSVQQKSDVPFLNAAWTNTKSPQGVDGGLILGYTYVFSNNLGLGLEALFNWAKVSNANRSLNDRGPGYGNATLKNSFELRVPISYVLMNVIAPKILLGWDNSQWIRQFDHRNGFITALNKARHNGFLWGLGVDFLLAKHIISGFEYTGVVSNNVSFTDQQGLGSFFSLKPVYNKLAITCKFIY